MIVLVWMTIIFAVLALVGISSHLKDITKQLRLQNAALQDLINVLRKDQ